MKYLVVKSLPIIGFEKGKVVDSELVTGVDFSNTEYFEPYVESKFKVDELVVYHGILCKVIKFLPGKSKSFNNYDLKDVNSGMRYQSAPECNLSTPTLFWFINSDGVICRDFEERGRINKAGLAWKKKIGNYFKSLQAVQSVINGSR